MRQRMFLKLDGVWGESKSPQHFGEIELTSFRWGGNHSIPSDSGEGQGKVLINHLTIIKRSDRTSSYLMLTCAMKQMLAEGRLTIEELSESGRLLRSTILKLRHILISSISADKRAEIVTLNFRRARLMLPKSKT